MSGNPAQNAPSGPHDLGPRMGGAEADHVGPSGMGSEGGAIGVITAMSINAESFPPVMRTVDEPPNEFLK